MMIWSHLPRGVEEDGAVCPIEMPGGTRYVDKVVCSLIASAKDPSAFFLLI
jgi:hypothetical protein